MYVSSQAKVLSKLSLHPNIISYYDSFEVDGTLMIEMEYADGGYVEQESDIIS
jgi:NIMA (never in mitosis gene a)-related kinase